MRKMSFIILGIMLCTGSGIFLLTRNQSKPGLQFLEKLSDHAIEIEYIVLDVKNRKEKFTDAESLEYFKRLLISRKPSQHLNHKFLYPIDMKIASNHHVCDFILLYDKKVSPIYLGFYNYSYFGKELDTLQSIDADKPVPAKLRNFLDMVKIDIDGL